MQETKGAFIVLAPVLSSDGNASPTSHPLASFVIRKYLKFSSANLMM